MITVEKNGEKVKVVKLYWNQADKKMKEAYRIWYYEIPKIIECLAPFAVTDNNQPFGGSINTKFAVTTDRETKKEKSQIAFNWGTAEKDHNGEYTCTKEIPIVAVKSFCEKLKEKYDEAMAELKDEVEFMEEKKDPASENVPF